MFFYILYSLIRNRNIVKWNGYIIIGYYILFVFINDNVLSLWLTTFYFETKVTRFNSKW